MVYNATFNNILVISRWSFYLWRKSEYPEKTTDRAASHWQTLSHNVVSSTPHLSGIWTHNVRVIGTGCIGSCKSNYHTITTTTAPWISLRQLLFFIKTWRCYYLQTIVIISMFIISFFSIILNSFNYFVSLHFFNIHVVMRCKIIFHPTYVILK